MKDLTVEILKTLSFHLVMHLNGGSQYSGRVDQNEDYGLQVTTTTDGSPKYRITSKTLTASGNENITVDLMSKDRDLDKFCKDYNEWRNGLTPANSTSN